MKALIEGASRTPGQQLSRHKRTKSVRHDWRPPDCSRAVPFGADETVAQFYVHTCRRCGGKGKRFPGNPHVIADVPGGCR